MANQALNAYQQTIQMENLFNELSTLCKSSVSELKDYNLTMANGSRLEARKFDLYAWRQRLEETAKGIDFCGGYLFLNNTLGGDAINITIENPQQILRLGKVMEHVRVLVDLVSMLPISVGRYYAVSVRDAAVATLQALTKLPDAWRGMRRTRQAPAVFVWNQTLRLRDIPENCLAHVLTKWERWTALLRESNEELKTFCLEPSACDSEEDFDTAQLDTINISTTTTTSSTLTPVRTSGNEKNTIKECSALIRLIRTLFRKIKNRCLNECKRLTDQDVFFIDEVYGMAEAVVIGIDHLISLLIPPHDPYAIVDAATRIGSQSIDLCRLAEDFADDSHKPWFLTCQKQLESSLSRLYEKNPLR